MYIRLSNETAITDENIDDLCRDVTVWSVYVQHDKFEQRRNRFAEIRSMCQGERKIYPRFADVEPIVVCTCVLACSAHTHTYMHTYVSGFIFDGTF